MYKLVLFIFALFSLALPQYGSEIITVKLSSLLKLENDSSKVINFDNGRSIKIINDVSGASIKKGRENSTERDTVSRFPIIVSANGDYLLPKSAAQKFGGGIPEVSFSPDWSKHQMTDAGAYYIFRSRVKVFGRQAYRFYVNGRQLPRSSMAKQKEDCSLLNIDENDIVNQDNGECFFYSLPAKTGKR